MQGVFTALITPFTATGRLDLGAFRRILRDQKSAGVAGVIPCGTTGESPTLSTAEKKDLITTAIRELKGSGVKVVAGTGSNNTAESVELSRWASRQGADGILVVTPYYNKPSQAGLAAHFRAVADAVTCEVVLYNVPGRTGVSLSASTIALLSSHKKITAVKEASGNVAFSVEVLGALSEAGHRMSLLAGDDATFLSLLSIGASGVVSVASNLVPRQMVALYDAAARGDFAGAQRIHRNLAPLFKDLFVDSNPVPIKYAMSRAGWCGNRLRLPLFPLSRPDALKLDATLKRSGAVRRTR